MRRAVLLDAGPLVAFLNRRDRFHRWAKTHWSEIEAPLLTCEAVLAEACHILRGVSGGPAAVLELVQRGSVSLPFCLRDEGETVLRLLRRYENVPMSLADACLVRMSELHEGSRVFTLDADFRVYRSRGRRVIPCLMPGDA